MEWIAFVILIATAVVVALLKRLSKRAGTSWPLKPKMVLSAPEQVLYWRLIEALPDSVVLAQVQLSRMLQIVGGGNRQAIRNRIDRKSADFVVCSKDLQPLTVIELDDASHSAPSSRKRDADKDAAVKAAGLRIIRFHVKLMPSIDEIRAVMSGASQQVDAEAPSAVGGGARSRPNRRIEPRM